MATDYILFIHGVNTRDRREQPQYADQLFQRLQESASNNERELKKIALYWGDVNKEAEENLLKQLQASPFWEHIWFKAFREQQLLQFAGDAALYISRQVGSKVVKELKKQTDGLNNSQSDDRLHLVTHSWGTVILFDILFAGRWDNPEVPGHDAVMAIRDCIYGLSGKDPNPHQGVQISSIHTMGSPVAIFTLTNVIPGRDGPDSPSTHDITPQLQKLLESLHARRNGKKLPWRNYIHAGDPIAYPLKEVITNLVDGQTKYLDIQDLMTHESGLLESVTAQSVFALLHGGEAHGSYFSSDKVVQEISNVVNIETPAFHQP
ncbi:hypothetical protein SAMD00079811_69520 [Scytonema sp. HK-05]|uniref:hypothetical protein n=1 Tax=Scytonema sp. HK-05 TaxID=1137095 RepID=UPI000935F129|nr:hypothetical protein [Scytonema sp. HK-05]OKH58422.1 hypothetical protein NIES2130_14135 [Scytonema sp. HK-05]BAY49323.1 hypothetical protein SAMD00079811_69520 [Scytonema sp. HK-05]